MPHTNLSIKGEQFLINGKLTYAEIDESNPNAHGLLMNAPSFREFLMIRPSRNDLSVSGKAHLPPGTTLGGLLMPYPAGTIMACGHSRGVAASSNLDLTLLRYAENSVPKQ